MALLLTLRQRPQTRSRRSGSQKPGSSTFVRNTVDKIPGGSYRVEAKYSIPIRKNPGDCLIGRYPRRPCRRDYQLCEGCAGTNEGNLRPSRSRTAAGRANACGCRRCGHSNEYRKRADVCERDGTSDFRRRHNRPRRTASAKSVVAGCSE